MLFIKRLSDIYKRICHAAMRAGRSPDDVRLVAVTKTIDSVQVLRAIDAGVRDFGESRVQEAMIKADTVSDPNIRWHMIGHLQTNKARQCVAMFHLIHSVDSERLLMEIDRQAKAVGKVQSVLIQANLSGERTKSGIDENGISGLLEISQGLKNIRIEGLMTITPYYDDPELSRPYYRRLKELACEFSLKELSMGMSGDFEVAIEEGATLVRIGSSIFGERNVN